MKNRFFCAVVICLMLAACATSPVPRQIQNSFPIDQSFEKVWQAVIETFAELNLPIMNMEKASGLITTDWISFRGQKNETGYCSCGRARFPLSEVDRTGKFNVYVKKIGEGSCEIKVNSVFEKTAAYQDAVEKQFCVSTGKLEKEIYDRVLEKTK
jgi:uncharacterized lipoprotein